MGGSARWHLEVRAGISRTPEHHTLQKDAGHGGNELGLLKGVISGQRSETFLRGLAEPGKTGHPDTETA